MAARKGRLKVKAGTRRLSDFRQTGFTSTDLNSLSVPELSRVVFGCCVVVDTILKESECLDPTDMNDVRLSLNRILDLVGAFAHAKDKARRKNNKNKAVSR